MGRLQTASRNVEADGYDTDRVIRFPGPCQARYDDVLAARSTDLQVSALGAAQAYRRIELPPGRIFDSFHAGGKIQLPRVTRGGSRGDRKRDCLAGFSFRVQKFHGSNFEFSAS